MSHSDRLTQNEKPQESCKLLGFDLLRMYLVEAAIEMNPERTNNKEKRTLYFYQVPSKIPSYFIGIDTLASLVSLFVAHVFASTIFNDQII